MQIYMSRLKKSIFHPVAGRFSFPTIHNNLIYGTIDNSNGSFDLVKWNGIDSIDTVATYSSTGSPLALVSYNNDLYVFNQNNNREYLCRKLQSDGNYTTMPGSLSLGSNKVGSNYAVGYVNFVVYNNKIHAFICKNSSAGINSAYQKGLHYTYNGTSWDRESTTGPIFVEQPVPVVWNNKIYIFGLQENNSSSTGLRIYRWDGSNWEAFYSKTAPTVTDSADTSTSFHSIYYRNKDGSTSNSNTFGGYYRGMCVYNNDLYIFHINSSNTNDKTSKISKFDTSYGDFVVQNDSYPQEENVKSPYQNADLLGYKDRIYAIGGFCTVSVNNVESRLNNTQIYRYNPSTKEWETE